MSEVLEGKAEQAQFPYVDYDEINPAKCAALEHFAGFDRKREHSRFHFGDAHGHPFWLFTNMQDIRAAFQDPELFSSRSVVPPEPDPPYLWIPEMLDPPQHTKWRQELAAAFAPKAVKRLKPRVEDRFSEILDEIAPRGHCDFVADVALRFPNTIFMEIMGLPQSDAATFQDWEERILHRPDTQDTDGYAAMTEVTAYFAGLIADRRKNPKDDLVSQALAYRIDGERPSDDDLLALFLLLFMAGLDTVAMQLSYSMVHLANNPQDRTRLIANPELWPTAIEEFLRYYAFVTPGRKLTEDVEYEGCPMKAGQMAYMPIVSANRDPAEFPNADEVRIDRQENRHLAFGGGPHRCLGSHLARQELLVGLWEWHKRIPDYRLDPDVPITEHGGQTGLDNVPLRWD